MTREFTGYARLRSRYGAFFIDVVFFAALWFMGALFAGSFGFEFNRWNAIALLAAYFGLFPATPLQGTPGKRACGIRIVDTNGAQIGVGRSMLRFIASIPSIGLLGIGFVPAAWNSRRQALHDLAAGTVVVQAPIERLDTHAPPASLTERIAVCLVVVGAGAVVYFVADIYHTILRKDACVAGKLANVSSCAAGAAPAAASPRSSTSSP